MVIKESELIKDYLLHRRHCYFNERNQRFKIRYENESENAFKDFEDFLIQLYKLTDIKNVIINKAEYCGYKLIVNLAIIKTKEKF